jgi:hypothetical protein
VQLAEADLGRVGGAGEADEEVDRADRHHLDEGDWHCRRVVGIRLDLEEAARSDHPAGSDRPADRQVGPRRKPKARRPMPHGGCHYRGYDHNMYYGA